MSEKMLLPSGLDSISVENLSFRPHPARAPILNCPSLQFEKGHFYGIIGPNGAGKTTLIRHLLRLTRVQTGKIRLNGIHIHAFSRRELSMHLSYVPQNIESEFSFTVKELVMMGRRPHLPLFSFPGAEDFVAVSTAMEASGITKLSNTPISVLSGGEIRSVLLARAVAQGASWFFLDEPVSFLDIYRQYSVMNMLRALQQNEEKTIVCVLHDINLAAAYCDRILVMNEGEIVVAGATSEVLNTALLAKVYGLPFHQIEMDPFPQKLFFPYLG